MAGTTDKLFSLPRILAARPAEFADRVAAIADMLTDSWRAGRPAYEPVSSATAFSEIERVGLASTATLSEPALSELETEVRRRMAAITDPSWNSSYNADPTMARLLYAICRQMQPTVVVETGVAFGMTSAYLLKALQVNGKGTLFSIDLPPLGSKADALQGALVPADLRARWLLQRGSSERQLGAVLDKGPIDLFVHDSLHTYSNMHREFTEAWPALRPGGVLVADDVQGNTAFVEMKTKPVTYWRVVQQEGKTALFGVLVKASRAMTA